LRRQYDRHLEQVAGLTEATRSVYWLFIEQFLWRFGRRPLQWGRSKRRRLTVLFSTATWPNVVLCTCWRSAASCRFSTTGRTSNLSKRCGCPRHGPAIHSNISDPGCASERPIVGKPSASGTCHGLVSLPSGAVSKKSPHSTGGPGLAAQPHICGDKDSEESTGATSPDVALHPGSCARAPCHWCSGYLSSIGPLGAAIVASGSSERCGMRLPGRFRTGSYILRAHGGHTASSPRRASQNHRRPAWASFHQRLLVTLASIFGTAEARCLGHDNAPEAYHDLSRAGLPEPAARPGL
jgi:hypothetical protein